MTLFMLRSIVDQVRQHHSGSNVEIIQQSMKIVLVQGDVLDVNICNARISVLTFFKLNSVYAVELQCTMLSVCLSACLR